MSSVYLSKDAKRHQLSLQFVLFFFLGSLPGFAQADSTITTTGYSPGSTIIPGQSIIGNNFPIFPGAMNQVMHIAPLVNSADTSRLTQPLSVTGLKNGAVESLASREVQLQSKELPLVTSLLSKKVVTMT